MLNQQQKHEIFIRFRQQNPHPTTELHYASAFELLIAVILSAQATDKSVNKVTDNLFSLVSTPQEFINLGEERLMEYIKTIGLYKTKARNIIKTCHILISKYQGKIPDNRAALESLSGVGRKTANVILNTVFGQATIAVDTHIFRVSHRIGLSNGKTPLATEYDLLKQIPAEFLHDAHHWLVLHGRYVCVARRPHCQSCLINDLCEYFLNKEGIKCHAIIK